jgi:hypothetical protein
MSDFKTETDGSVCKEQDKRKPGRPKKIVDLKAYKKEWNKNNSARICQEKGDEYKAIVERNKKRACENRQAYHILRDLHNLQIEIPSEIRDRMTTLFEKGE